MKNTEPDAARSPVRAVCRSARRYAASHLLLRTDLIRERFPDHSGYSIAVTVLDLSAWSADFAAVRDIALTESEAHRLFVRIVDGRVTPCTLRDVAEDWLADGADDL